MVIPLMSAISHTPKNDHSNDLKSFVQIVNLMMILTVGLVVASSGAAATSNAAAASPTFRHRTRQHDYAATFGRRAGLAADLDFLGSSPEITSRLRRSHEDSSATRAGGAQSAYHQSTTSQDLASADQLDEPAFTSALDQSATDLAGDPIGLGHFSQLDRGQQQQHQRSLTRDSPDGNENNEDDEAMENSQDSPDRNIFMDNHQTHLRAMRDMFERRHLDHTAGTSASARHRQQAAANPLQSSQELSPISIGLDPGPSPAMAPFQMGPNDGASQPPPPMGVHLKPQMSGADNLDGNMGPALPFGLNPLPHLLGFQSTGFDGPQWGDQSAHSNHHAAAAPQPDSEMAAGGGAGRADAAGAGQKTWPKIFRFTDGRINLSDFEKQKKIRLSNKNQHGENHIESAPLMFDGRPLKRKSFLILHGGVFPGN